VTIFTSSITAASDSYVGIEATIVVLLSSFFSRFGVNNEVYYVLRVSATSIKVVIVSMISIGGAIAVHGGELLVFLVGCSFYTTLIFSYLLL